MIRVTSLALMLALSVFGCAVENGETLGSGGDAVLSLAVTAEASPNAIILPTRGTADLTATVTGGSDHATVHWARLSGPSEVRFSDHNAQRTVARFASSGQYVLEVTAMDNNDVATAQVTVSVELCTGDLTYHVTDLDTTDGDFKLSEPFAVNDAGDVVGKATFQDGKYGFLWRNQTDGMESIGSLTQDATRFSLAADINNQGIITGQSSVGAANLSGIQHAIVTTREADGSFDQEKLPRHFRKECAGYGLCVAKVVESLHRWPFSKTHARCAITIHEWVGIMKKVIPLLALPSWLRIG